MIALFNHTAQISAFTQTANLQGIYIIGNDVCVVHVACFM